MIFLGPGSSENRCYDLVEPSFSRHLFGYHVVYDRDLYDAIGFAPQQGFGYVGPDLMIPRFFPIDQGRKYIIRKSHSDSQKYGCN